MKYTYRITEYRVVDGDTIRCTIDLGFHLSYDCSVRLIGIDTPELNKSEHHAAAVVAEKALRDWVDRETAKGVELMLRSRELDKFGRVLGTVFVGEPHYSAASYLLRIGVAKPALDGRRHQWTDEELRGIEDIRSNGGGG